MFIIFHMCFFEVTNQTNHLKLIPVISSLLCCHWDVESSLKKVLYPLRVVDLIRINEIFVQKQNKKKALCSLLADKGRETTENENLEAGYVSKDHGGVAQTRAWHRETN